METTIPAAVISFLFTVMAIDIIQYQLFIIKNGLNKPIEVTVDEQ